jgi:large conductance mechanosensitive channel
MLKEFRDFVARGNVLDLAVAVIIGAAFATIIASLTDDIIMPVIGMVFGGLDFGGLFCMIDPKLSCVIATPEDYENLRKTGVPVIGYGRFITVAINFLILAFVIFLIVRWANRLRRSGAPAGPSEVELLVEIRDELKKR